MTRIILTTEQFQSLMLAREEVELCDPNGKVLCHVHPLFTEAEIARAKTSAHSKERCYSSAEVQETLRILDETWKKEGPFDQTRLQQILAEIRKNRENRA